MKINKISIINRGIAIGLMLIMACFSPVQTLASANGGMAAATDALTGLPTEAQAAEKKDPYIKEVRLAVDKKADKAKQILEDDGYEVVDLDLNQTAGSIWNKLGDQAVYMGIKRTADESKAIRDMKTMNMLGRYSYTALAAWVEDNRAEAREKCAPVFTVLEEFKKNLNNDDIFAVKTKEMLDRFVETDSGMNVGDYLLSDKCDEDGLVKLIVEGNTEIIGVVLKCLLMGAEEENDTWLERLSGITKSSLTKQYTRELYGVDKVSDSTRKQEIEKLLNADYLETAEKVLKNWDSLRDELIDPEAVVELTEEDEAILEGDEFLEGYVGCIEKNSEIRGKILKDRLKEIPYSGKSLYDLFTVNKSYFEKDITRLFPVVAAMTPGQRMMCEYANLADLANLAVARADYRESGEADFSKFEEMAESIPACSVYFGVERDMFGDDAAMTSRATAEFEGAGGESATAAWVTFAVSAAAALGLLYLADSVYQRVDMLKNSIRELNNRIPQMKEYFKDQIFRMDNFIQTNADWMDWEEGLDYEYRDGELFTKAEEMEQERGLLEKTSKETYQTGKLLMVATLIMAIVATTSFIIAQLKTHNKEQTSIPEILVDMDVESKNSKYVAYRVVKWNKDRNDDTGRGNRGDLNGDAASQWLALYTTTDTTLGDPILADSILARTGMRKGDICPGTDYYPLTLFGQENVQNLLEYSYNDKVLGVWIWYQHGTQEAALVDDTEDDTEKAPADETAEDAGEEDTEGAGDAASGAGAEMTGSNIGGGNTIMIVCTVGAGLCLIAFIIVLYYRRIKGNGDKAERD